MEGGVSPGADFPGAEPSGRWNRTIMISKPQLHNGSIELVPESIRQSIAKLHLLLAASVEKIRSKEGVDRYWLREVGVGYGMLQSNKYRIVTTSEPSVEKDGLGFIGRQILSENEKQLKSLKVVASNSNVLLFDAPAIFVLEKEHRNVTMRHAVVLDPQQGRLSLFTWLFEEKSQPEQGQKKNVSMRQDSLRKIPEGFVEDRRIHVDGNAFTLGIPSQRAFALIEMPAGEKLTPTDDFQVQCVKPSPAPEWFQSFFLGAP